MTRSCLQEQAWLQSSVLVLETNSTVFLLPFSRQDLERKAHVRLQGHPAAHHGAAF